MKLPDLSLIQPVLEGLAAAGRPGLLPALHAAQAAYGYIPDTIAAEIGKALKVPLVDVYGVIGFYDLFSDQATTKNVLRVCTDPSCALAGADQLLDSLRRKANSTDDSPSPEGSLRIEHTPCLGLCNRAPAVALNGGILAPAPHDQAEALLQGASTGATRSADFIGGAPRLLTARCGRGHPTTIDEYRAARGYQAFAGALRSTPDSIISEVKASGLVGRGGAAFPTAVKWEGALRADGEPKYVVCNADESEPGTFKDRILLEGDPHSMLEGLLIAGYAVQAVKGYIYIRGEYYQAYDSVSHAIDEARLSGLIGKDILGSGWDFEIELFRGAGAYICGEETALFESIEGKRGFPRSKPPFPTTHGLFGKPTAINNVETLCCIPSILLDGAVAFKEIGTEKSTGTKLFCVSGDVVQPGLYELPYGTPLRQLVWEHAGGMPPGEQVQAVLIGGAAGAFVPPDQLDVRLSFEDLKAAGLPLGSGVIMVLNTSRDIRDVLLRLARFFAHESCGKCFPCQLGTQRQLEVMQRVAAGNALPGDMDRLTDVGWTMTDASICGLGQTAASAVLSALKLWPGLFAAGRQAR